MVIISNQILIDFLRLNKKANDIRNQDLGKHLDKVIILLGGKQKGEVPNGRDNEDGKPLGFPKTSMSYDFPESQLDVLFINILSQFP